MLSSLTGSISRNVPMLVGEPARSIEALVSPAGELAACGILQLREDASLIAGHGGRFAIPWRIDACLDQSFADFAALRGARLARSQSSIGCFTDTACGSCPSASPGTC